MGLGNIKASLETFLNDNLTDVAIKWSNTNTYTLNGTALTELQVANLTLFVEPLIIPLSEDKTIFSNENGYKNEAIFQLTTYGKQNKGMGAIISNADTMNLLYREEIINDVVCEKSKYLASFNVDEWVCLPIRIFVHKYFA